MNTEEKIRDIEMRSEEWWDEFCENIGTDLFEVEMFAGRDVITQKDFHKAVLKAIQSPEAGEYWKEKLEVELIKDLQAMIDDGYETIHIKAVIELIKNK